MKVDIAIVGAGPAGLSLAKALSNTGLDILLVDQQSRDTLSDPPFDGREIALTPRSVRIMQSLGQWQHIGASEIAPLHSARVLDGFGARGLHITPAQRGDTELGCLVPNHAIRRAAYAAIEDAPRVTLLPGVLASGLTLEAQGATLQLSDDTRVHAQLVVAADSRFSPMRRAAGIAADMHDVGKTMMVCRMALERAHDDEALEWFGHGQTLALLPLRQRQASVVLTLPPQAMKQVMELDKAAFNAELERRFDHRFGAMQQVSTRHAYPLVSVYARRFVAQRFALAGDAAVGMHPVTAHGFNLGLRGVETLAKLLGEAAGRQADIASATLLQRYERTHRLATAPLYAATMAIVKLFTDDRALARKARAGLLAASQALPPFRQALARMLAANGTPLAPSHRS